MDLLKKQKKQIAKLLGDHKRLLQLEEMVKRFDKERETSFTTVKALADEITRLKEQLAASKMEAGEVPHLTERIVALELALDASTGTIQNQVNLLTAQDRERDRLTKEREDLKKRIDEKELEKTRRRLQERSAELEQVRRSASALESKLREAQNLIAYFRGETIPQVQGDTK